MKRLAAALSMFLPFCAADVSGAGTIDPLSKVQPSEDWLMYSGSYNSQRYSSLKQVTTANAHTLQVKWIYHVPGSRGLEVTPVVKDGVMYIPSYNRVDAIDARTGNIIWRYQRPPASTAHLRGTTVYENKIYITTSDARLMALDIRTGGVVWDVPVNGGRLLSGAAPLVAHGKLIVGAIDSPNGFIQAYDAQTGKYIWTWSAIPKLGEPESKTWSDGQKEGGGAVWMSGSFDPEQNVIIYGTGQPNPPYSGEVREGDDLYSDSIVALDVDTYQFTRH